jgi:hypothetical protein
MSRSRNKFALSLLVAAVITLFTVALPSVNSGSAKTQKAQKANPKRSVSEIRFYRGVTVPPLKIHNVKVRDKTVRLSTMFEEGNEKAQKPLIPEEEFDETDDFYEKLQFDATNRSDKIIKLIEFALYFYTREGLAKPSFDAALLINYATGNGAGQPNPINPGETVTISLSENHLIELRDQISNLKSEIVRVGIYANFVIFEDGVIWNFTGSFQRPEDVKKISRSNHKPERNIPSTGHFEILECKGQ